jgi:DNA polymerase
MTFERATIDFETRSVADLEDVGAWLYSKHPTTEILCLSYHLPGMPEGEVVFWHCAHPEIGIKETSRGVLKPLFEWIKKGGKVEAHNCFFEECIWRHVAWKRRGWPKIRDDQWIDSAAKAAAHSLPRDLGGAGRALHLPVAKDAAGKALIRKYSKPKRLTKLDKALNGEGAIIFNEDVEGLAEYWEYNKQDVRAEVRLSKSIPDLRPAEYRLWRVTQEMNRRGVAIDVELCHAALDLVEKARGKLNAELEEITGMEGVKGSQRALVKEWLEENEKLFLPDTKAATLEFYLERKADKLTPRSKCVLEIVREVNRTSPKKYQRMLECVDTDGRARELLVYCGAERTGRFAGRGIQIHNLPKGKLPKGLSMDTACEDVKTRDLAWCEMIYGDVMNLIVSCLRGAIIAPPGRELISADYSAIEARCVLWLAMADAALNVFREGKDIYCDMASGIFGREITKENAKVITSTGATERDFGKVAVLGLGYGMGFIKFLITLRTYKIFLTRREVYTMMGEKRLLKYEAIVRRKLFPKPEDYEDSKAYNSAERQAAVERRRLLDERENPEECLHELALCKYVTETYRARYSEVPKMWKDQEAAAIEAVKTRKPVKCGRVIWFVKGRYLKCRLPSGRCLHYCDPEIKNQKTSWGESRPGLRFMGRDQKSKKWVRQGSYGGKLTENITQATARDIMAHAKVELADTIDYDLLLSIHDEIVVEIDEGRADRKDFEIRMADLPECYEGCPITAEAKVYKRYRK